MDLRMVGFRIREIRTNKNLTQEELAELADISVTHISALERGVKNANLSTFVAIANALQVSADTLLIHFLMELCENTYKRYLIYVNSNKVSFLEPKGYKGFEIGLFLQRKQLQSTESLCITAVLRVGHS